MITVKLNIDTIFAGISIQKRIPSMRQFLHEITVGKGMMRFHKILINNKYKITAFNSLIADTYSESSEIYKEFILDV